MVDWTGANYKKATQPFNQNPFKLSGLIIECVIAHTLGRGVYVRAALYT